jgi:hypothetical protein
MLAIFEHCGSDMPKYGQVLPLSLFGTRLPRKKAVILTAIIGAINSAMIVSSGTTGDAFLFNGHLGLSRPIWIGFPKNHHFLRL